MNNKKFGIMDWVLIVLFLLNIILALVNLAKGNQVSPILPLCGWFCALLEIFKRR
jgi:hypothetical protein